MLSRRIAEGLILERRGQVKVETRQHLQLELPCDYKLILYTTDTTPHSK